MDNFDLRKYLAEGKLLTEDKVVSEVGPETAGAAIKARIDRQDPRADRIVRDAVAESLLNAFNMSESLVIEGAKEVVLSNEILDFLEERGILKGSDAQKVHKDLTSFLKEKGINEAAKGGQIMPGDYVKTQYGDVYLRVDGKVGKSDAYVRVIKGKAGKRKTGLHDSMKLTLVNNDGLEESVVNEVGPETAGAAIKARINRQDPRADRIVRDAVTSLFSKFVGAKKLPFSIITSGDEEPNARQYDLVEVKLNRNGDSVIFYFYNKDGVDSDAPYAPNKKNIEFTYNMEDDKYDDIIPSNSIINRYTANFLKNVANISRKMYHSAYPWKKMIPDPDRSQYGSDMNKEIVDPKFDIKSQYQQANEIPIRQF